MQLRADITLTKDRQSPYFQTRYGLKTALDCLFSVGIRAVHVTFLWLVKPSYLVATYRITYYFIYKQHGLPPAQ